MILTSRSSIVGLFSWSRPRAIIARVWTIVVLSFEHCPIWSLSHIRKEVLKFAPRLADCNSSRSIAWIAFISRVRASLNHRTPYMIFRNRFFISSRSVRERPTASQFQFTKQATAASNLSRLQITGFYDRFLSAIALAGPIASFSFINVRFRDNGKSFESFTDQIKVSNFLNNIRIAKFLPAPIVHGAKGTLFSAPVTVCNGTCFHGTTIQHGTVSV